MPHAVITGATEAPALTAAPLARDGALIHKVTEVAENEKGWLLKSLILNAGEKTAFLTRIDRRDDGLVVHLDDHVPVTRTDDVFHHLALIARAVLAANPKATLGKTNLADRINA